jgi:hypothetical protein
MVKVDTRYQRHLFGANEQLTDEPAAPTVTASR